MRRLRQGRAGDPDIDRAGGGAKLIPINRTKQHAVEKEIRLMEKLRECPFIGLRGIQQDASYYYIYMEMANWASHLRSRQARCRSTRRSRTCNS